MEKQLMQYHPSLDPHAYRMLDTAVVKLTPCGTGGRPGAMHEINKEDTYVWGVSQIAATQKSLLEYLRENMQTQPFVTILAEPAPESIPIAVKLKEAQQSLGINVSALSKILHTSRTSLYAWFDGDTPKPSNIRRIEKIYEIAKNFQNTNTSGMGPRGSIRQPLVGGSSWQDALMQSEIDVQATIKLIPQVLNLMAQAAENNRRKPDESMSVGEHAQRRAMMDTFTGVAPADDD